MKLISVKKKYVRLSKKDNLDTVERLFVATDRIYLGVP